LARAMSRSWVDLSPPTSSIHDPLAASGGVQPVAGSVRDAQLAHATADGLRVSGVTEGEPRDPREYASAGLPVLQACEPPVELVCPMNLDHTGDVACVIQPVKKCGHLTNVFGRQLQDEAALASSCRA